MIVAIIIFVGRGFLFTRASPHHPPTTPDKPFLEKLVFAFAFVSKLSLYRWSFGPRRRQGILEVFIKAKTGDLHGFFEDSAALRTGYRILRTHRAR